MSEPLIDRLSTDLRPVARSWAARRLALGAGLGALVAVPFMALALGLRSDLPQALRTTMFWIKLGYALAIGAVALWTVDRLARPGVSGARRGAWLLAPVAIVAGLALLQLARTPARAHRALVMGESSMLCPWLVVVCALPFLAGLVWAVRGMAPTRLRTAGAAVGLAAGGLGAVVYALHCGETGAPFLAIWYSLGIAAAGLIGLVSGPRLLRW